jgi:hypothetical protein
MTEQTPFQPGAHDPSQLTGNIQPTDAEKRRLATGNVGEAINEVFSLHPDFVQTADDGSQRLQLSLARGDRKPATIVVSQRIDKDSGARTVDLAFKAKDAWTNGFIYRDGAGQEATLVAASSEKGKSGMLEALPEDHYNNQDREVAWWGDIWPDNLRGGQPEHARKSGLVRRLGRKVLGR